MNFSTFLIAIFIAVASVGWAIVGNHLKMPSSWLGTITMVGTTLPVVVLFSRQLVSVPTPEGKALTVMSLMALANGVAIYLYAVKLADRAVPAAIFVVSISVLMAVVTPLMSWMLNGAVPTLRQTAGFACATLAIYLLGR